MAKLQVGTTVFARTSGGQFAAACDRAATETAKAMVAEGARISRRLAPKGKKPDPRTVKLSRSITSVMYDGRSGAWGSSARHAMPQEHGARDHRIYGNPKVGFYWDAVGRHVSFSYVDHPGNAAQPFLRPAYKTVMTRAIPIARDKYPG